MPIPALTLRRLRSASTTLLCAATLSILPVSAQAPLDIRVALVIGNSAYPASPLLNPANDAGEMGRTLRALGFTVIELRDAPRSGMAQAIERMRAALQGKQGVGMLYYAGHGLQLDWRNYLVPVDARLATAADVPVQTIDINAVIEAFKSAGNRMNILVLDACRDNPFAGTASGKGLAQLDAPPSTILAYATAPGNVAEDGDASSGNGLYTQYLLEELRRPAAKIEDVFKRVRFQVRRQSQGRQIPWESTSLEDDFYFNDGVKYTIGSEELARLAALAQQKEQARQQQEAQARAREAQLAEELAAERQRQADARARQQAAELAQATQREQALLAAQAREREAQQLAARAREEERLAEAARLQELERQAAIARQRQQELALSAEARKDKAFAVEKADWDRIADSKKAEDFYAFLQKYPNGSISELAQARLERLEVAKVQTQADRSGEVQSAAAARYRHGDRFEFVLKDGLTGLVVGKSSVVLRRLSDDELEGVATGMPSARVNSAGFVTATGAGRFDPPWPTVPGGEFQVGKKWSARSIATLANGSKQWVDIEAKISAREAVTIPLGTLEAYRVDYSFVWQDGRRTIERFWYQPDWGYAIKYVRESRRGATPDIFIREMSARQRGSS